MPRSTVTMQITGFKELERALSELPKATGKAAMRRAGKTALEPMADLAAAKAPRDTGILSFSIVVSEQRTRRAKAGGGARFIEGTGWRRDAKTSVDIAMGPAGGLGALNYAWWVEFGTVDTPAASFMRVAFDSQAVATVDRFRDAMWEEVRKSAARLARRQTKLKR